MLHPTVGEMVAALRAHKGSACAHCESMRDTVVSDRLTLSRPPAVCCEAGKAACASVGHHAAAWMSGFSSVGHAVPPAPETPKAPRPIVVEQMERNQPEMTRLRHVPERLLKALHLADTLDAAGLGSAEAIAMDANEWRLLAMAARSRKPSEPTRDSGAPYSSRTARQPEGHSHNNKSFELKRRNHVT